MGGSFLYIYYVVLWFYARISNNSFSFYSIFVMYVVVRSGVGIYFIVCFVFFFFGEYFSFSPLEWDLLIIYSVFKSQFSFPQPFSSRYGFFKIMGNSSSSKAPKLILFNFSSGVWKEGLSMVNVCEFFQMMNRDLYLLHWIFLFYLSVWLIYLVIFLCLWIQISLLTFIKVNMEKTIKLTLSPNFIKPNFMFNNVWVWIMLIF